MEAPKKGISTSSLKVVSGAGLIGMLPILGFIFKADWTKENVELFTDLIGSIPFGFYMMFSVLGGLYIIYRLVIERTYMLTSRPNGNSTEEK